MKCSLCGFVYNGHEHVCPYCGQAVDLKHNKILNKNIKLGFINITFLQLFNFILTNIVFGALLINILTKDEPFWAFYVFAASVFLYLLSRIIFVYRDFITILKRADTYIALILAVWYLLINSDYFIFLYVIPIYSIAIQLVNVGYAVFINRMRSTRGLLKVFWVSIRAVIFYGFLD